MHSKPGCVGHQGGCRAQKCHGLTWNHVVFITSWKCSIHVQFALLATIQP